MKKSLFLICLILLLMPSVSIMAQIINTYIVFDYDDNGNRTSVNYICMRVDENEFLADTDELSPSDVSNGDINLSIYPNPTTGYLVLASEYNDDNQDMMARLFSVQGNLIEEKRIVDDHTEFDLTQAPAGIYFLYVENTGEKLLWKIIKK